MIKILFASSEAHPFVSSGGLGDVTASLPPALCALGADIRVVLPLYGTISEEWRSQMRFVTDFRVMLGWRNLYCGVFSLLYNGVTHYFLDNEYYFKRAFLYGSYDDGERYAFFSRAILDMLPHIGFYPDVLHTNDWQTALSAVYLRCRYRHSGEYRRIRALHTIHNMEYQGKYNPSILEDVFDLDRSDAHILDYDGDINLTKGAIVCSDRFSTVSPRYAEEIKYDYYSHGMHHIVWQFSFKLRGILNGIDPTYYNPEAGEGIFASYSADDLSGKEQNKRALLQELSLPEEEGRPLLSMVTRLTGHKGMDLIIRIADDLLRANLSLVILGTGEHAYEQYFLGLQARYPDKVRALIRFDRELSKKLYAASDIFIMPSKSEPCGLSQMIACRYGTLPVVRETGGLADTITYFNRQSGAGNGFCFSNYNAHELLYTLWDAVGLYTYDKELWKRAASNAMRCDFSWNKSAGEYLSLYEEMIK